MNKCRNDIGVTCHFTAFGYGSSCSYVNHLLFYIVQRNGVAQSLEHRFSLLFFLSSDSHSQLCFYLSSHLSPIPATLLFLYVMRRVSFTFPPPRKLRIVYCTCGLCFQAWLRNEECMHALTYTRFLQHNLLFGNWGISKQEVALHCPIQTLLLYHKLKSAEQPRVWIKNFFLIVHTANTSGIIIPSVSVAAEPQLAPCPWPPYVTGVLAPNSAHNSSISNKGFLDTNTLPDTQTLNNQKYLVNRL